MHWLDYFDMIIIIVYSVASASIAGHRLHKVPHKNHHILICIFLELTQLQITQMYLRISFVSVCCVPCDDCIGFVVVPVDPSHASLPWRNDNGNGFTSSTAITVAIAMI